MRQNQSDGLRMFVNDERQQILAVDLLQKAERHRLDLLPNAVQRVAGVLAKRLSNEALSQIEPARPATKGAIAHALCDVLASWSGSHQTAE